MAASRGFLILSLLLALLVTSAVGNRSTLRTKRAAYFLDNDPAGDSIVSLKISYEDGKLSSPIRTPTGGKGLWGLTTTGYSGPDSLFSQDAIIVNKNYLFAVNAGSRTLSMFVIDEEDPWHPTLVGTPADTLGEFPISVTYSSKLKTACVLNAGAANGVTCFSVDRAAGLIPLDKSPRSLSEALFQATPPTGPTNTASDVVFNPSSTALFAIVKGNGTASGPGYIYTWPVNESGQVSHEPIITVLNDVPVPFSFTFLGTDSKLIISDPSFGAAILSVSQNFTFTVENHIDIPFNLGACWTAYAPSVDTAYVIDGFRPNISFIDTKSNTLSDTVIQFTSSAPLGFNFSVLDPTKGAYDAIVDRNWLYVLGGEQNLFVFDTLKNTQVQDLNLTSLGNRIGWEGLAIYPAHSYY